jgi:hypothetical protein
VAEGEEEPMAIEGIRRGKIVSIEELRARRRSTERTEQPDPARAETTAEADRDRLMKELRAAVDSLPDVRDEKVIEAKLRVSSGYYEREDVRREILRSLLASLLPRPERASEPDARE